MSKDPSNSILRLLLSHQRIVEAATVATAPPLDALSSYLLALLQANYCQYFNELVALLGTDKTRVSRTLSQLEKQRLLTGSPSPSDRRQRALKLTAAGLQLLEKNNRLVSQAVISCLNSLTSAERSELERMFRKLADAFACPDTVRSPGLHPLLGELRRLSRAFGIIGSQFAATALSTLEFQVLLLIIDSPIPLRAVEVSAQTGLPRSTVSRIVQSLIRVGHVEAVRDASDRRNSQLTATTRGQATVRDALTRAAKLLSAALTPLGQAFAQRFEVLLEKYAGSTSTRGIERISFTEMSAPHERQEACIFVVNELLRQGKQDSIDEQIFFENSRIIAARDGRALVGVCEFVPRGKRLTLRRIVLNPNAGAGSTVTPRTFAAAAESFCVQQA